MSVWLDIFGSPGSGKSSICDPLFNSRDIERSWNGERFPDSWRPFLAQIDPLLTLVRDHKRPVPTRNGQISSIQAMVGMLTRNLRKMSVVNQMQGDPYIGTAFAMRGIGIGWRLLDAGHDPNLVRSYFWTMPTSIGCVYLKCSPETLKQRNRARRNVPATSWEDRSFQIDIQAPVIAILKEVLKERGVPLLELDTEFQSIDDARAQLIEFSRSAPCETAVVTSGSDMVPTSQLVTSRRFDLAIKHRYFKHLIDGNDPDSERVYCGHIVTRSHSNAAIGFGMDAGKTSTDEYVDACKQLLHSMKANGFMRQHAIPIDPDGELLGGAHRLSCAIALGIEAVPVVTHARRVFAPAWDDQWFADNGLSQSDLERLRSDHQQLCH